MGDRTLITSGIKIINYYCHSEGISFTHVSTGGGASLELMAGDKLPGVESLLDA